MITIERHNAEIERINGLPTKLERLEAWRDHFIEMVNNNQWAKGSFVEGGKNRFSVCAIGSRMFLREASRLFPSPYGASPLIERPSLVVEGVRGDLDEAEEEDIISLNDEEDEGWRSVIQYIDELIDKEKSKQESLSTLVEDVFD